MAAGYHAVQCIPANLRLTKVVYTVATNPRQMIDSHVGNPVTAKTRTQYMVDRKLSENLDKWDYLRPPLNTGNDKDDIAVTGIITSMYI